MTETLPESTPLQPTFFLIQKKKTFLLPIFLVKMSLANLFRSTSSPASFSPCQQVRDLPIETDYYLSTEDGNLMTYIHTSRTALQHSLLNMICRAIYQEHRETELQPYPSQKHGQLIVQNSPSSASTKIDFSMYGFISRWQTPLSLLGAGPKQAILSGLSLLKLILGKASPRLWLAAMDAKAAVCI
ncbi:hypothetical protein VTN77DRAFT_8340 [Rasamsonia byssochlamydoides]|uniref:uncharacterized protein n=1 Tax=Rasamsonia byssochlamydoides TaxID=89139 RepID=UPI0037444395